MHEQRAWRSFGVDSFLVSLLYLDIEMNGFAARGRLEIMSLDEGRDWSYEQAAKYVNTRLEMDSWVCGAVLRLGGVYT